MLGLLLDDGQVHSIGWCLRKIANTPPSILFACHTPGGLSVLGFRGPFAKHMCAYVLVHATQLLVLRGLETRQD